MLRLGDQRWGVGLWLRNVTPKLELNISFLQTAWLIYHSMISVRVAITGFRMKNNVPKTRAKCLNWLQNSSSCAAAYLALTRQIKGLGSNWLLANCLMLFKYTAETGLGSLFVPHTKISVIIALRLYFWKLSIERVFDLCKSYSFEEWLLMSLLHLSQNFFIHATSACSKFI